MILIELKIVCVWVIWVFVVVMMLNGCIMSGGSCLRMVVFNCVKVVRCGWLVLWVVRLMFVCQVLWSVLIVVLIMFGRVLIFFSFFIGVVGRVIWMVVCRLLLLMGCVKLFVSWIVVCLKDIIWRLCWLFWVVVRWFLCMVRWLWMIRVDWCERVIIVFFFLDFVLGWVICLCFGVFVIFVVCVVFCFEFDCLLMIDFNGNIKYMD